MTIYEFHPAIYEPICLGIFFIRNFLLRLCAKERHQNHLHIGEDSLNRELHKDVRLVVCNYSFSILGFIFSLLVLGHHISKSHRCPHGVAHNFKRTLNVKTQDALYGVSSGSWNRIAAIIEYRVIGLVSPDSLFSMIGLVTGRQLCPQPMG